MTLLNEFDTLTTKPLQDRTCEKEGDWSCWICLGRCP